jgi:hypothetical protein
MSELDEILKNYKELNYKKIEKKYRDIYPELNGYRFIKKNNLYKLNMGGIIKYISRETNELKTALLLSVIEIDKIVKLIKVKNLAHNNVYKLKASNYFYFYHHKTSIYYGTYAITEEI